MSPFIRLFHAEIISTDKRLKYLVVFVLSFLFSFFFIFFFYKPERVLLLACSNNVCLDASVDNVQSWAHEFHGMVWQSSRSIVSFTEFV